MTSAPFPKTVPKIVARVIAPMLAVAAALGINACTSLEPTTVSADAAAPGADEFQKRIKPLFEHRCAWCHNNEKPNAGLNFENRALVLNPSSRFVVPGKPDQSRLYNAVIRDPAHMKVMPADGWGVTEAQKRALHDWIAAGAPWPEGKKGDLRRKDYRVDIDGYL